MQHVAEINGHTVELVLIDQVGDFVDEIQQNEALSEGQGVVDRGTRRLGQPSGLFGEVD